MTSTTRPGKTKEPTYQWLCADRQCKKMDCFQSSSDTQTISHLWETNGVSGFHDAQLLNATAEINAILSAVVQANKNPQRKLSFIKVRSRLMLAWAEYGTVGPNNDEKTVIMALGLKTAKSAPIKSKVRARETAKKQSGVRARETAKKQSGNVRRG
jgi:hypothetical protein